MRILHTSDWHLGRSFHREGMLQHQASYVDHLLEAVEKESVDLVVVSGDVYDRALPAVDAVALADETLVRLARSRAQVVISSGNHDSAHRLGFSSRLIDEAGVFIRTDPGTVGTPVILADDHGPVVVHALPYLDPLAVAEPWALSERSHRAALSHAMTRVRADLAARDRRTRSVALAHAFVIGGEAETTPSDSERDISVGGISHVPAGVFDGPDYVALGHLHGRHTLSDRLRYSGSPLAYSFSEATHRKGSWLVELGSGGLESVEFIEAPVPRRLARLRGSLDELLTDPDLRTHEESWLEVTLTDVARPAQAMDQIRRRFPHTLVLSFDTPAPAWGGLPASATHSRSESEIAVEFMRQMRGSDPTAEESALLLQAVDACCADPDADPDRSGG
ncbi:exonuclease SbcCD subunit D [Nocardioides salsibiostraticola]